MPASWKENATLERTGTSGMVLTVKEEAYQTEMLTRPGGKEKKREFLGERSLEERRTGETGEP